MLLFIVVGDRDAIILISFQYITCYCLSQTRVQKWQGRPCFNTSHVTVYPFRRPIWYFGLYRFNTSHVTVYPRIPALRPAPFWFQYITCYCLSCTPCVAGMPKMVSIHHMLLFIRLVKALLTFYNMFQYITCYCLSLYAGPASDANRCFNTSHVTVYLTLQTTTTM